MKIIIPFWPRMGYPVGQHLFYRCKKCLDILPSKPKDSLSCKCGNLRIDIDYGRLAVDRNKTIQLIFIIGYKKSK